MFLDVAPHAAFAVDVGRDQFHLPAAKHEGHPVEALRLGRARVRQGLAPEDVAEQSARLLHVENADGHVIDPCEHALPFCQNTAFEGEHST